MMRGLSTLTLLATLVLVGAKAETAQDGELALFPASGEARPASVRPVVDLRPWGVGREIDSWTVRGERVGDGLPLGIAQGRSRNGRVAD